MSSSRHQRSRASGWLALGRAQIRVPIGIVAAYDGPVLGRFVRAAAGPVREEETEVGGVPAIVFRPGRGGGPWPTTVLFPGVTRRGRNHPAFLGIGRGLAATGHLAIVAEPEGLAAGELTPAAVRQAREAVEDALSRADAARTGVSLLGVSGGGTLALRTAADPSLAERVSIVLALAPLCDVEEAIRVVTTGVYRDGDTLVPFTAGDFFRLVIARSIVACLAPGDDRNALRTQLLALDDYATDPLASLAGVARRQPWSVRARRSRPACERGSIALRSTSCRASRGVARRHRCNFPDRRRSPNLGAGRARRRPRGQVHHARGRDLVRGGMPEHAADRPRLAGARRSRAVPERDS